MAMRKKKDEKLIHLDMEKIVSESSSTKDIIRKKIVEESGKADVKTLGETLRTARKAKGKDYDDITKKICVKPVYLEALETGKFYAFPNMTYGVGFLRLYATYLGLDPKEMIDKFKQEVQMMSEPVHTVMPVTEASMPSRKILIFSLSALLLGLVGFCAKDIVFKSKTELTQLKANVITPSVMVEEETTLAENMEAEIEIEKQKFKKKPAVYGNKEKENISLKAISEVWLEILNEEGKIIFSKILTEGDVYNLPKESGKYSLNTGNAGALQVLIDQETPRMLGEVGAMKQGVLLDPVVLKKEMK